MRIALCQAYWAKSVLLYFYKSGNSLRTVNSIKKPRPSSAGAVFLLTDYFGTPYVPPDELSGPTVRYYSAKLPIIDPTIQLIKHEQTDAGP